MAGFDNVEWGLILPTPIKRLNIAEGAPVSKSFLREIKYVGKANYNEIMNLLFDENEIRSISWYWKSEKLIPPSIIYLYRSHIKQHLRFGRKGSIHFEEWIFGILKCSNETTYSYRLYPFKRDSDFNGDIFKRIYEMCENTNK